MLANSSLACSATVRDRSMCSGHGYYCQMPSFGCICDHGWTGLGDFSISPGEDCDINKVANVIIFYLIIIQTIACMVLIARFLRDRNRGRKWKLPTLDSKTIFPWIFLLAMANQIIFAIAKINYQENQIVGRDLFVTVLAALLPSTAQAGVVLYFFVVIKCLNTYTHMIADGDKLQRYFARLSIIGAFIPPLSLIFSIMPIIAIPYPKLGKTMALIYLIGNGMLSWCHGVITCLAISKLVNELTSHVKKLPSTSGDLLVIIKRLRLAYFAIIGTTFSIGFSYFAFGVFDYLLRKSSYLFIYQQLSCAPASTILILTVSKIPVNHAFITREKSNSRLSRITTFLKTKPSNFSKHSESMKSSLNVSECTTSPIGNSFKKNSIAIQSINE